MRGGASKLWAWRLCLAMGMTALVAAEASAQVSITTLNTAMPTQDFNTLATSGSSSTLPAGWALLETNLGTGTSANSSYTANAGTGTAGDTYSYGTGTTTERALGSLQSNSLTSTFGAQFENNSGTTITSLSIQYVGEQWRTGGRNNATLDQLDFQLSTDATGLGNGTWTDYNSLDFITRVTAASGAALDGNAAANKATVTFEITGLSIAPGAKFWIRWVDLGIAGSDDGLAIDDFVLTPKGTVATPPALEVTKVSDAQPGDFYVPGEDVTYLIEVKHAAGSGATATGVTLTDTFPDELEPIISDFGTIVGQTLTYDIGSLAVGEERLVEVVATVRAIRTAGSVSNTASVTSTNATTVTSTATIDLVACGDATDCEDDTVCTTDTCDAGGSCQRENNTESCADLNLCNGDEVCGGGTCQPGTPTVCNDGLDCTEDYCEPTLGCRVTPIDGGPCNDGDACTLGDQCVEGVCQPGGPEMCGDIPDPCNVGTCNPASGCEYTTTTCDDNDPCTMDMCVPMVGCQYIPGGNAPCDDHNGCTQGDTCNGAGQCVGAGGCDDGDPCTIDNCGPGDVCNFDTIDVGAECDDDDPCTAVTTCQANGQCGGGDPTTAGCDDHNPCTENDTCNNFACAGSAIVCNDNKPCTDDACVDGVCTYTPNTDPCGDGNACNGDEVCSGGECQPGTAPTCNDDKPCTRDSCDPASGCKYEPDDTLTCADADLCNGAEVCSNGLCVAGTALDCNDNKVCTDDSCEPATGCKNTNNTVACGDGDKCNGDEVCADGACQPGTAPNCDDNEICTTDSCDALVGCKHDNNTLDCDDHNASTRDDKCGGGSCHGTTIVCPTVGTCQEAIPNGSACPITNKAYGATCDDQNASTIGDQCDGAGVCVGRTASTIAQWTFETLPTIPSGTDTGPISPEVGTNPPSVGSGHHVTAATTWSKPGGSGSATSLSSNNWKSNDYYQFKTSTTGFDAISISWDTMRSSTGPANFIVMLSTDGTNFTQVGASYSVPQSFGTFTRALADASDKAEVWVRFVSQSDPASAGTCRIDNVTFTGAAIAVPAPKLAVTKSATPSQTPLFAGGTVAYEITVAHHAASTADAENLVLTDTLPAHSTATGDISVTAPGLPATLTAAADDDAGEIVSGVVTVRLGDYARGGAELTIGVTVTAGEVATATTLSNTATVAYDGPDGAITPAASNTTATLIVLCGSAADCADTDPCTDDACTGGNCVNAPNTGNSCDDDDVCNGEADACDNGLCKGTVTVDCGDGNVCTDDLCDPVTGCSNPDNSAPCSDGDACTSGDVCVAGACTTGPVVTDCDDDNACTTDSCDVTGGCVHDPSGETSCDDHNACTTGDACDGPNGTTCAGTTLSCDDNDFCTTDSCDPAVGCAHVAGPLPESCNDDNPCTTDSCSNNACVNTPNTNPCEADDNPCTDDVCQAGACAHPANTASCDDEDSCTTNDRCANKACGGRAVTCDDGKQCTSDSCDPDVGCVYTPKSTGTCDDNNPCTVGDSCQAGACVSGTGVLGCNDNNPCTADSCSPSQGCVHDPIAAACNDGSSATSNDQCKAGVCSGTPIVCNAGTCQLPGTPNGIDCPPIFASPGVTCDDGLVTTSGDHCDGGGLCVGAQIVCPPEDVCARYEPNGVGCTVISKEATCDDGFVTTRGDRCVDGVCEGTAYTCTPTQCEVRSVPNGTDCVVTNKALGIKCDDGALTTWDDRCDGEGACVGKPYTCDTVGACVVGSAPDGKGGCTTTYAEAGTTCDDLDPCTVEDACDAAGACAGTAAVCGEGELCGLDGSCELTHCRECEADAECGLATACVTIDGIGGRCLVACDSDAQCATGQVCRADAAGAKRCWDESGECAAPAGTGDEGPDTVEVVEAADEVEEVDEVEADVAEPDVTEDDGDVAEDDTPDASDVIEDTSGDTAVDTGPDDTEEPGPEESEPGPEVTEEADPTPDTSADTADTGEPNIERVELAPDSVEEGGTVAEGGGCATGGAGGLGAMLAAALALIGWRARSRRTG